MTINEGERIDYKIAILRRGCFQYQIAAAAGLTEYRLSMFLRGRGNLKPDQLARLQAVLGLEEGADVSV
jgi:hypothetical protein